MKIQIVSLAVLVLAIAACVNAQAAGSGTGAATGPPPFCQIYQIILQSEATKISSPDLPVDLQLRVDAILENASQGCADCEGQIIWLEKVCLVANFRLGLNQLAQIKAEADARANATTAAPLSPAQ